MGYNHLIIHYYHKVVLVDPNELRANLWGSFLLFTRTFYPLLSGRDFIIPNPPGRESHVITIARALTKCARLQIPEQRLIIAVPPGHGKSTLLSMWIAWTMSKYPDSKYLYISYSHTLAATHTDVIRRIMMLKEYHQIFGVQLRADSKAKDFFQTTAGGAVGAFGSSGAITGRDAGLPGLDRFSGALILDDPHKPDEVFSDTMREKVINNYKDTIQQRARGINVPFILIGQRLHEADLGSYLLNGEDGHEWERVILKSIDDAGNPLYPEAFPLHMLRIRQERDIYVFSAQHQQDPQPAGGAIFKKDWFIIMDYEPEILMTFITADTAETDKDYNDATAFCFWGVYEIETMGRKTGEYGLHWIDAVEIHIEPKDLKDSFLDFWQDSMRHSVRPLLAVIEKKSTGTTLISVLQELRSIQIRSLERTRISGSKTKRFLECQPHIAAKKISFTKDSRHIDMCINHMTKITANDSHRRDDLCDCAIDAIKIALIDKTLVYDTKQQTVKAATILQKQKSTLKARSNLYGGH
jgi:hypothetical protein